MPLNLIKVDHLPKGGIELPNKLLPFLWFFVRQAKWSCLLIAVSYAISDVTDSLSFYFIKIFVDLFAETEARDQIWQDLFWPFMVFTLLCLIVQPVAARIADGLMATVRPAFANMMRRQLALHMNDHSFQYFQDDFAGRLSSKVIETPYAASNIIQTLLNSIWFALSNLLMSLIFMMLSHWMFAVLTLVWIISYTLLLRIYIPRISRNSTAAHEQVSQSRGRYVDIITNILTVKIFARRKHEDRYFLSSLKDTAKGFQKLQHKVNEMYIWLEVISVLYIFVAFLCVIWGWQNEMLSAGDVAMILPLTLRLMNISWWMSDVFTMLFESFGQLQEGMETITRAHTVTDREDAPELAVRNASIEIRNMSFGYGRKND